MSKQVLEEISEAPPFTESEIAHIEIAKIRPVKPATSTCSGFEGTVTQLIILLPEFGVAEDMIGLRDLLETALSLLIPGIQIGMMFARQSTISFLNLLICGRALDPSDIIIITLRC